MVSGRSSRSQDLLDERIEQIERAYGAEHLRGVLDQIGRQRDVAGERAGEHGEQIGPRESPQRPPGILGLRTRVGGACEAAERIGAEPGDHGRRDAARQHQNIVGLHRGGHRLDEPGERPDRRRRHDEPPEALRLLVAEPRQPPDAALWDK